MALPSQPNRRLVGGPPAENGHSRAGGYQATSFTKRYGVGDTSNSTENKPVLGEGRTASRQAAADPFAKFDTYDPLKNGSLASGNANNNRPKINDGPKLSYEQKLEREKAPTGFLDMINNNKQGQQQDQGRGMSRGSNQNQNMPSIGNEPLQA